jgi:hypothetical protein
LCRKTGVRAWKLALKQWFMDRRVLDSADGPKLPLGRKRL